MGLLPEYSGREGMFSSPAKQAPEKPLAEAVISPIAASEAASAVPAPAAPLDEAVVGIRLRDFGLMALILFGVLFAGMFCAAIGIVATNPALLEAESELQVDFIIEQYPVSLILGSTALMCMGLFAATWYAGWRVKYDWTRFGFVRVENKVLWQGAAYGLFGAPVTLGLLLLPTLGTEFPPSSSFGPITEGLTLTNIIIVFVLYGGLVPVAEEIFFRGVLYTWLRKRHGPWIGNAFSTWMYAILNVAAANFLVGLLIGGASALIYERSGSVWPSVVARAVHGAVTIFAFVLIVAQFVG